MNNTLDTLWPVMCFGSFIVVKDFPLRDVGSRIDREIIGNRRKNYDCTNDEEGEESQESAEDTPVVHG